MNVLLYYLFAVLFIATANCADDERPLISIEDGVIRGSYKASFNGRKYMAFEGIPYAKPPIQKLRFREPEPVEPWPGVLDATSTYTCLQLTPIGVAGQEDCLYLNVYIPRESIDPEEKLDVIVHIHGGGFMLGDPASLSGPTYFMDRDVVYINFNYRLGPFGFYSLNDNIFHGNYGLKDQGAVLEWVQKNVEKFGGNKDSVTLTGLSAGGASVHLHYFSTNTRTLFHRGFAHSGTAMNPWAVKLDAFYNGKPLAEEVGCFDVNMKVVYRCLKQRSALQIVNGVRKVYKDRSLPLVPFGPTTESYVHTGFLMAMPYLQLASKHVADIPLLISMTTEEGTLPAAMFYDRLDELNANWTYYLPIMLDYYDYEDEKKDEISNKIREFYFKDEPVTKENFGILVKLCSQRLFHIGAEKAAKLQANATDANIYFLMMGYSGETRQPIPGTTADADLGVGHGMDARFYYDWSGVGVENLVDEREIKMKDILIDMVVTFAKTGEPKLEGVDFLPVPKEGNLKYLSIKGPDDISMKSTKRLGAHEFWKSLELKEDENVFSVTDKMIEIF